MTPPCFFCDSDCIVLEDLCAQGFKMAERRQGLDLTHCVLIMRMLAKLHAASVVLHDQDPESMSTYDQNFFSEPESRKTFQNFVSGMYSRSQMSLLTHSIIKFYETSR